MHNRSTPRILISMLVFSTLLLAGELLPVLDLSILQLTDHHRSTLAPDSMIQSRWNDTDWSRFKRNTYHYNLAGALLERTQYVRFSGLWFNNWRDSLGYNAQGQLVEWRFQLGTEYSWLDDSREQYSYDEQGHLSQILYQRINDENTWRSTRRVNLSYNDEDLLVEEIAEGRMGSTWLNDFRKVYDYTTTNALDTCLRQTWDYDTDTWLPDSLMVNSYDPQGNLTQWRVKSWEEESWQSSHRETYSYNGLNQRTEAIFQLFLGSNWYNLDRIAYDYDELGFLASATQQEWDYDSELWWDLSRQLFNNDIEGNVLESTSQYWFTSMASWLDEYLYEWFYPSPSSVEFSLPEQFVLNQNYPNPFNPSTTISYSLSTTSNVNLTVFDIRGREIISLTDREQSPAHYQVNWNGLDRSGMPVNTGVYFCRLTADGMSQTIKMLYLR